MEDGLQKKVTEKYVVNALSHSEAEERITEEMSAYISGEFEVKGIVPAQYKEIFFMSMGEKMVAGQTEDLLHAVKKNDRKKGMEVYERELEDYPTDTRWYKVRLLFLTYDEKSGKEKRTPATYLVQGVSVNNAAENTVEALHGTMMDYVITSVAEQPIIDVFEMTAAELMDHMAEDLKDRSLTVESIVDKYVTPPTPELRQQLIDRLNQMRDSGQVPEKE